MRLEHVLADTPGGWVVFRSGGVRYRARRDPMYIGPTTLAKAVSTPGVLLNALDLRSREKALLGDVLGKRVPTLIEDYLTAAGLDGEGLGLVVYALHHIEDLEVDLLRVGLDVRDWLDPDGGLSTRRVSVLLKDFQERPETRIGAAHMGVYPIDKAGIAAAQNLSTKEEKHLFLWSRDQVDQERAQVAAEEAKRRRIAARFKTRGG